MQRQNSKGNKDDNDKIKQGFQIFENGLITSLFNIEY